MRHLIVILLMTTTAYAANFSGSVTFISGSTTAGGYLLEEKYEGVGIPSGHSYVDSSGTNKIDWDDTTPTMEGSKSAYIPDPGSSGQNKMQIEPGADTDEMWASMMVEWVDTPVSANTSNFLRLSDTVDADVGRVGVKFDGSILVITNDGGSQSAVACTIATGTTYWIKIRAKKGTGADAEVGVWCTDNTTSWGSEYSSTDGTWVTQLDYVEINNYYTHGVNYNMDHLIIDDANIPITAYQ